jgi:hypothetical protein
MDAENIFVIIIFSAIGIGYASFGKRRQEHSFFVVGIALCSYSFFLDGMWAQLGVGIVLTAVPLLMRML